MQVLITIFISHRGKIKKNKVVTSLINRKKTMSFASQLANFEKSISNHNRNRNNNNNNSNSNNQNNDNYQQKKRQRHNNNNYDDKLQNEILNLSKSLPSSSSSIAATPSTNHIALLFLIIDELPFENIWESWINDNNNNNDLNDYSVSVLIHAKYPERIRSEWIKQHLIIDEYSNNNNSYGVDGNKPYLSFRPEWGSIEITRAMIELVQHALRIGEKTSTSANSSSSTSQDNSGGVDDDLQEQERYTCRVKSKTTTSGLVDRFIFISESCIPFQPLTSLGKALYTTHANKSWINYRNTPNNGYARQLQWDRIHNIIPRQFIHKSDQWLVLTRYHSSLIVRDVPRTFSNYCRRPLYTYFDTVKASDEMYFSTILSMSGVNFDDEIYKQCVTYCDWEGMSNTKNPATFTSIKEMKDVYDKIIVDGGYYFGRKFQFKDNNDGGRLSVEDWLKIVNLNEGKEEEVKK